MGQFVGPDRRTYSLVAPRIEPREVEALIESGCPVVSYIPGGRLLWPVSADYGIGWLYTAAAVALGAWFVLEAHRLLGRIRGDGETKPMKLFHVSISYLALLSIAIIVDVLI